MSKSKQEQIDNIFQQIGQLHNQDVKNKITKKLPVIIALGDQSSGKSSIFSRIIEHHLPIKDGCCTRVPVQISLKRKIKKISITIKNNDNKNYYNENENKEKSLEYGIEQAQKDILDNAEFSSDIIRIEIPNEKYDITFIDLPGLTAYDQYNEEKNQTYKILDNVKKQYDECIIFHVIASNTEYEKSQSIIEINKIDKIKKTENKMITVFTKTDLIQNKENLKILNDNIMSNKKFIMSGLDDIQEKNHGIQIDCGIDKVMKYINEVNEENINKNFDIVQTELKSQLNYIEDRLNTDLKPYNEIISLMNKLKDLQSVCSKKFDKYFRQYFKKNKEILYSKIKKLKAFDKYTDYEIDVEKLEIGNIIYYYDNCKEKKIESKIIEKTDTFIKFYKEFDEDLVLYDSDRNSKEEKDIFTYHFNKENNPFELSDLKFPSCYLHKTPNKKDFVNRKTYYNHRLRENRIECEECYEYHYHIYENDDKCKRRHCKFWIQLPEEDILKNIKEMLEDIGELEPSPMKDTKQIVFEYTQRFTNKYTEVLEDFISDIKIEIQNIFEHCTEIKIGNDISEILNKIDDYVDYDIYSLKMKNSIIELIATPNNHYLSENIIHAIKDKDTFKNDDGLYKLVYCNIEGFLKVQNKYVIERIDHILNENYYYRIKKLIEYISLEHKIVDKVSEKMFSKLKKHISEIKVKDEHEKERNSYLNDKDILKTLLCI